MLDESVPLLRVSDLNENSTRYDTLVAAPADEQLVAYWYTWAGVAFASGTFIFVVFLAIVTSHKHIRKQSFNLYLVYLMIPDFMFSFLCATTCLLNAINGSYWSHWMCNFQQFYCVWGIGSNCWINAVISYEIHKLLNYSQQRRRYFIPSNTRVTFQALGVYAYCAFLSAWGLMERENFPHHTLPVSGLACLPVEIDRQSSFFFWFVFFPMFCGIPIVYVVYTAFDIWRRKLLPPNGKRRLLAHYFGRIVLVFLAMWLPFLLITYVLSSVVPMSVLVAGGAISHLQGPVSAAMALLKPDVMLAVRRFLRCRCGPCAPRDDEDDEDVYEKVKLSDFQQRTSFLNRMRSAITSISRSMRDSTTESIDALAISERLQWIWPDQDRSRESSRESSGDAIDEDEDEGLEEGRRREGPTDAEEKEEEKGVFVERKSVKFEQDVEESFRNNPE